MKRNLIVLIIVIFSGFIVYVWGLKKDVVRLTPESSYHSDILYVKKAKDGSYRFHYPKGESIWIHRSFREKSRTGGYRGRGPRAGK